ncbi:hypothetical protein BU24DRAFT_492272 [Aaosphaeria arxii CBS 175.79]|uniref:Uncharacterized protein n=1 Tax=Aaosphaeria arxii CBS 175.79 TaxID=1450172 RepID=A0A6A5XT59_9PLEO|nr:uncharacterized protein BU24DRAFT_492272 [Aaosphaeria arxii CBS 175.79]KAF2016116.1 hypothetical protein BU24DRAFT_492272 [Aaosphaeria arxii CBS 175.79]
MAPDLNSVPASPRNGATLQAAPSGSGAPTTQAAAPHSRQSSTPASRRASQIYPMSPPPLPLASPGGTIPSSQQMPQHNSAFPPLSPGSSAHVPNVDATGVPMRHPRPLTAAELHLELEKEQEAVVNRLTRELSALRAHSASVASTASSATSGVLLDVNDPSITHTGPMAGATHPTASRRHRSSSSVSRASINAAYGGPTSFATGTTNLPHRYSMSSQPATSDPSTSANPQVARSASVVSTPRYEEVAHYRQELEEAKRENDALKRRIRELERLIRSPDDANTPTQRGRLGAPTSESDILNGETTGNDTA